jgi:hypothetical protein
MATTPDDLTTGDVGISESENSVDGKYLLIKVPDFGKDIAGDPDKTLVPSEDGKTMVRKDRFGEGMTSFLRLGAASKIAEPGDDLVQYAYEVGAGPVGFTGELELESGDTAKIAFIDDERNRGDGDVEPLEAQGHGMSPDERYNWHTKHLETRGGWRDHSDGNRISTTYGDKLEVVRGNYKLIVMGRQDSPGNAQGHEWSGNHVQDWGQGTMPGASVTLEWIQSGYVPGSPVLKSKEDPKDPDEFYLGGAWLLINSTERVYQYSRNAGNFRTQQWGEKLESYVGSEDPESIGTTSGVGYLGHPTSAEDAAYHKVLDDDDLVGKLRPDSVGLPRGNPEIIEKTWARSISSSTGSSIWRIPQINEDTWAVNMSDSTHAESITSKTSVTSMVEETKVGSSVSTTYAGAIVETTIAGMNISTSIGPVVDIFVGLRLGIEVAGVVEVSGPFKVELSLGYSGSFHNFKDEMAVLETKVSGIRTDLTTTNTEVAAVKTITTTTTTDLAATRTDLNTTRNTLAATQTSLGNIKNDLQFMIFMG